MAAICLLSALGVYVAAKIDFFRRYDPANVSGYIAGHWPFWVAMVVLTGLGYALAYAAGRASGRADGKVS
jgi:hypothetical protein